MNNEIPTSVLTILEASQEPGEKLTTLKCRKTGSFDAFTKAVLFPGEREIQIKEILGEGDIISVKVKGVAFKECKPFSIITPLNLSVKYGKRAYFMPKDFHTKDFFSGDYTITGGVFSGYRIFDKEKKQAKVIRVGNMYSVDFPDRAPLVPGGTYYFENAKGFKGDMNLVYPGYLDKKDLTIVNGRLDKFRARPGVKGIYSIILRTDNYVKLPFFLENESFDGAITLDNGRAMEREYEKVKARIIKQSKASGGIEVGVIKKNLGIKNDFFYAVANELEDKGIISIKNNWVVFAGDGRENCLSPLGKEAYRAILDSGELGISVRTIKNPGVVSCYKEIERMSLAVALDQDLYIEKYNFVSLIKKLFANKNLGDNLTIQETRDILNLSRRYIISLFDKLEELGYIERGEDDERTINKIP